ncbi:ribonuclease HII [bacterium]|nr:ribonuclease HII [bacterium]
MPDFKIEKEILKQGYSRICGIDEVGRGSWAGPVVVCATIIQSNINIKEINDSKKITKTKRDQISEKLKKENVEFGIGKASNKEIDRLGIMKALNIAASRALNKLYHKPDIILLDGTVNYIEESYKVITRKKADEKSITVASASIFAKVYRDKLMEKIHRLNNNKYNFHKNKGYGTKEHKEKIDKNGLSSFHRKSYNITNSWKKNLVK